MMKPAGPARCFVIGSALESALEGLQDAAYRREVLEDEQIDQLRRRTEPEQMARDLSRDARRRGL